MQPNFEKAANEMFDIRIAKLEEITGREFTDKPKWRKWWLEIYAKNEEIITKAAERVLADIWEEMTPVEDSEFFEWLGLCNKGNGIEMD